MPDEKIMRQHRTFIALATILLPLSCLIGCGGGGGDVDRFAVSGTVTVDGTPLTNGVVNLSPASGTHGPSSGGPVIDGKFMIPKARGPVAGKYTVKFIAFRETGKTYYDPDRGHIPEQKQLQFNESPLDVEITAEAENQFDFKLTEAR